MRRMRGKCLVGAHSAARDLRTSVCRCCHIVAVWRVEVEIVEACRVVSYVA